MTADEQPGRASMARIDELARKADSLPDPFARAVALDLAQGVMALHAETLERILRILAAGGTLDALASDDLVGGVLAMHGLHPEEAEPRVRRAVERLRLSFGPRGAEITLLEAGADEARVRIAGVRPGAAADVRRAIEDAIYLAAPELERVDIVGLEEAPQPAFVPVESLIARTRA